ncbi:MAG: hypothetical protein H6779_00090 [Candidatus Nomurabacteria bacterium]|nr:MAG: hypothetical protein H6779_00090 [Candidatus Nomurabacteria bacterium]
MKVLGVLNASRKSTTTILVGVICLQLLGVTLIQSLLYPLVAEAAVVVIEGAPSSTGDDHTVAGSDTVFIDDNVGYKFYRSGSGTCDYKKTTDKGATWGTAVTVDNQTDCIGVAVWYDRWTPGDTGSYIHIATLDTSLDEMFYNRLDTTNDTLLVSTSISTTPASSAVYTASTNRINISKATDGKVYMVVDDGQQTNLVSCTSSCQTSGNWSAVGTAPEGNADSWSILMPLASGDMMLINRSTSDVLRSSNWNGSFWSSMNTIDASAIRSTSYDVGMAATVDIDSGDIYLAYAADNDNFNTADHDVRSAKYSGGSWALKTDLITNYSGAILQVAISRDQNTNDIYVAYTARSAIKTAGSANLYYKKSTDGMTTWGTQQGPVNSTSGDFYGVDMNIMSYERVYVTWFDNITAVRDIFGETIADLQPDTILSSLGTQKSQIRDNVTNTYIGGSFALQTNTSKTVSNVVLTESGTIDASANLANIKLYYDLDTSTPYDCNSESYSGTETQFGSTVTGGFSGANGTASFTNTPISISTTQSICFYAVMDVLSGASDGDTIEISVSNPKTDVIVSGGVYVYPYEEVAIASTTTVVSPDLTQNAYHFRNDDGTESGATSATGGTENTPLAAMQANDNIRIRFALANQGSTSSVPTTYRLEYGAAAPTCADASWSVVNDTSALFLMYDSSNLTDGNNTTNIATSTGGVSNLGSNFITSNGGMRDTSVNTGTLTLDVNDYIEFEYSIIASSTVVEGETYCFRITANGTALNSYTNYPSVTIAADVTVDTFGTQTTSFDIPTTTAYIGGGFSIKENTVARNITSITVHEAGTVAGDTGISNLRLYYELDTFAPYDCASESYNGTETQFGATNAGGFSDTGEKATFSGTIPISLISTACIYVVMDVTGQAANGETINVQISSPNSDVVVSGGGSVGPSGLIEIASTTTLQGGILTQSNYHFRNDNGNETGATSATGGSENTVITDFAQNSSIRVRFGVTNTGSVTSVPTRFRLEYSPKITTCNVATVWTDVDAAGDGWEMEDSINLTNGETTTNIAVANGGVSDGVGTFIGTNGGVRDTESQSATTTITSNDFLDLEYSIKSNTLTNYDTTYCFRVSAAGTPISAYTNYAEITTSPKRDFFIQRGSTQVSGASATLLPGTDYTAPASNTRAFVRITNSNITGAGKDSGGGAQNADDTTAYISSSTDLAASGFTISRPAAAANNTRVDWEIVEFIGSPGTDNEIEVRTVDTVQLGSTATTATGTSLSNVADDTKVVVFITGSSNENTASNFYAGQVTAEWDTTTQSPVFKRGDNGSSIVDVSYAVVEFVGVNWNIQRVEHNYTDPGTTETESITSVNSLARTFIHVQKRMGASANVLDFGHEVWMSSIGAVSFYLEPGAATSTGQTSVAWIIENTQTSSGAMQVQRSNGLTTGGTTPFALSVVLTTPVSATNNSSITATTRAAGANTTYPRPIAGFTITSTSTYQLWRSNTGSDMSYRVEIVEWPVASLALRQNYYRFYDDNDALKPTDPWPPGASDLGENTSITDLDEPLGVGDQIRVRMTVQISNANMPAGFQDFRLQYGLRSTTCSAIPVNDWIAVGGVGSSTVWRGYSGTGTTDGQSLSTDPPTAGDLVISVSDRAGTLEHDGVSAANPFLISQGENVEYDWYLEHNGANAKSTYCFRMIRNDGTTLDSYSNYPQIRTVGFSPAIKNWRWYSDQENETPTSALAAESVAPTGTPDNDTLALRVNVKEKKNINGDNIKFKLQYSKDITFASVFDVVSTSSCTAASEWCYLEGGGVDNQTITTAVLSDSDTCLVGVGNGCGIHNTIPNSASTHSHPASTTGEYSFTITQNDAGYGSVYYFRLYDITNDLPVEPLASSSYPSLVTESTNLVFTVAGVNSGTTTAGVTTNISTTPTSIGFGDLLFGTEHIGAHRITINTNGKQGYQVLKYARQQLLNSYGTSIPSVSGTNPSPLAWSNGCTATSTGCIGYHTTDGTLSNASTRFAADDTYAGLDTNPAEIMYSSIPINDTHDIVYRIKVNEMQEAGDYQTEIVYLAIPSF